MGIKLRYEFSSYIFPQILLLQIGIIKQANWICKVLKIYIYIYIERERETSNIITVEVSKNLPGKKFVM